MGASEKSSRGRGGIKWGGGRRSGGGVNRLSMSFPVYPEKTSERTHKRSSETKKLIQKKRGKKKKTETGADKKGGFKKKEKSPDVRAGRHLQKKGTETGVHAIIEKRQA